MAPSSMLSLATLSLLVTSSLALPFNFFGKEHHHHHHWNATATYSGLPFPTGTGLPFPTGPAPTGHYVGANVEANGYAYSLGISSHHHHHHTGVPTGFVPFPTGSGFPDFPGFPSGIPTAWPTGIPTALPTGFPEGYYKRGNGYFKRDAAPGSNKKERRHVVERNAEEGDIEKRFGGVRKHHHSHHEWSTPTASVGAAATGTGTGIPFPTATGSVSIIIPTGVATSSVSSVVAVSTAAASTTAAPASASATSGANCSASAKKL